MTSSLPTGNNSITAKYSGDGNVCQQRFRTKTNEIVNRSSLPRRPLRHVQRHSVEFWEPR